MGYFKKHWLADLQEDVVTCTKEVVQAIRSLPIQELIPFSFKIDGYY
jgi:hypothetical protein